MNQQQLDQMAQQAAWLQAQSHQYAGLSDCVRDSQKLLTDAQNLARARAAMLQLGWANHASDAQVRLDGMAANMDRCVWRAKNHLAGY